jgi:CDGSH-type Zn-finger protein
MAATIQIEENGPLRVEGEFDLISDKGEKLSEGTWMKIALCRCGKSAKKPFCDGSHKRRLPAVESAS